MFVSVFGLFGCMSHEKQRIPVDSSKVCGTFRFMRHPIYHQSRLIEVCEKAVNSKICTQTIAELTRYYPYIERPSGAKKTNAGPTY